MIYFICVIIVVLLAIIYRGVCVCCDMYHDLRTTERLRVEALKEMNRYGSECIVLRKKNKELEYIINSIEASRGAPTNDTRLDG